MTNRVFVDSSVLVEYLKNNQTELFDSMLAATEIQLCISQTVASEYLFHFLASIGQKSPRSLKEKGGVARLLMADDPLPFLELFTWLPDDVTMLQPAIHFMRIYNLLPNDALIFSACKLHNIPALASFDPDFNEPCQAEDIRLLQTPEDFEIFKSTL